MRIGHFELEWISQGLKSSEPPNPSYPLGIKLDVSNGARNVCILPMPYPAPCVGVYSIKCTLCGITLGCTAAGRPDDAVQIKIPCVPFIPRGFVDLGNKQ